MLDGFNKEVVLRKPEKFEVKFVDDKKVKLANVISVFKSRKMISNVHTAYLSHVVDT